MPLLSERRGNDSHRTMHPTVITTPDAYGSQRQGVPVRIGAPRLPSLAHLPYSSGEMSDLPDWEERCALALTEIERIDLDANAKLERVRRMLKGELESADDESRAHDWVEIGMDALQGTDASSPGQSIKYRCRSCDARGYRIVFPTSVTLYPIVSDSPNCT